MGEVGFRVGSKAKFTQSESHCRIPHVASKWLLEAQKPRASSCCAAAQALFLFSGRKGQALLAVAEGLQGRWDPALPVAGSCSFCWAAWLNLGKSDLSCNKDKLC